MKNNTIISGLRNAAFIATLAMSSTVFSQTESNSIEIPAVIKRISVEGTAQVSASYILKNLQSQKNNVFDRAALEHDLKKIIRLYSLKNIYLIQIDSVHCTFSDDSLEVNIRIFVTENKVITIGQIEFSGNFSLAASDLLNVMNSGVSRSFDPKTLEMDIEEILRLYEDTGYPFAKVTVAELKLYEENGQPKLAISLHVSENQKTLLTQLEMSGQQQTRSNVLLREMRLTLPRLFRRSDIETGLARIRRFPFITEARAGELAANSDSSYRQQIVINEGPSNIIDGVAGYVPKTTASKGYFTGIANLSFQNLYGTARRLDVRWQKKNRYSQEFLIAYTEPWIFNFPLNLSGSFQQWVQDTTYVEQQMTLDGSVWLGTFGAGLFGLKLRYVDAADPVTSFLYNIPTAKFASAYIGVSYDTRDNPYNPRKGTFYKAQIEYGRKKEDRLTANNSASDTLIINGLPVIVEKSSPSLSTQKITLDFETIISVTRQLVFYNALHGAVYKSPQTIVPYSEQLRFGGLKTLRGYTEDFFNGTRAGWNNFELRWLTSPRSRIFTFVDLGYYYRNASSPVDRNKIVKEDGWPLGYGFGIRFETQLGLFALDFGLGKKDSFGNGKIHFGIAGQF
ncbi:BamA/TamA family outer membrane protein [bacterium]|nr:BamA/TamA family outer membrane protein [bacterium]